jgi:hypothetical protein
MKYKTVFLYYVLRKKNVEKLLLMKKQANQLQINRAFAEFLTLNSSKEP